MEKKVILEQNLLERALSGDRRAQQEILELLEPMILQKAKRFVLFGSEREDLLQEARLAVTKAFTTFDPAKNDNFLAFAHMCISNALKNALRHDRRQKEQPLNFALPLTDDLGLVHESAEKTVLKRAEFEDVNKKIGHSLSAVEKKVLLLFAGGYSYKEIAQKTGLKPKAVDNALARARAKLS